MFKRLTSGYKGLGEGRLFPTLALSGVVLLAAWLGTVEGGYFTRHWGLPALFLIVLGIAVSITGVAFGLRHRYSVVSFVLFGLYTLWTFASLLWSSNLGAAWLGAGQTLFYLLAFGATLVLVMLNASRRWVLAASVFGPAAVAVYTLLNPGFSLDYLFYNGRLFGTVGYHNGEAAFLLISFWAAIYLAGSRRVNPFLRAGVLAAAVLNTNVAVLTQSRGAMVALALSLPVYFLLSGQRLRGLIALIPVAVAVAVAFPELNSVYLAFLEDGNPAARLDEVLPVIWLGAFGAGLYSLCWGLIDRQWRPPVLAVRLAGASAVAAGALVLVIGITALVTQFGNPTTLVEQKWEAFKTNDPAGMEQSRYLSVSGSGRYTLWQVARENFAESPVLGIGTNAYEATYYQLRDQGPDGAVRQPHMLPLEVLAERGAVGGILFFGFLAICFAAGLHKRFTDLNTEGKAQVGALMAAVTYWFIHSSVEWFWQLSAVTVPAMVYLAMLVAPWQRVRVVQLGWSLRAACAGALLVAAVAIAPLYAADYYLVRSYTSPDLDTALEAVERAQGFNPWDPRLHEREAELALEAGRWSLVEEAYDRAIALNPDHYAPYMYLGSFHEQRGETEQALSYYRKALELNPLDRELNRSVDRLRDI